MDNIIYDRDLRQDLIVSEWLRTGAYGIFLGFTGFGKTHVALKACKLLQEKKNLKVLVIVPTIDLFNAWSKHFIDWNIPNATVMVINTAIKQEFKDNEYDLVIYDEIHEYPRGIRFSTAMSIVADMKLGLTATLNEELETLLKGFNMEVFDVVPVEECEAAGYTSPFVVFNVGVPLTISERAKYDYCNSLIGKYGAYFDGNIYSLTSEEVEQIVEDYPYFDDPGVVWGMHRKLKRAIKDRNDLLALSEWKLKAAEYFIRELPIKTITFNKVIASCERLLANTTDIAVVNHSKSGTAKKREKVMESFKDGSCGKRVLHTVQAVDQGFDDQELMLGIVLGWNKEALQSYQRTGRIVRKNTMAGLSNNHKFIIFLYAKDTKDEKTLVSAQETLANEFIVYANSKRVIKHIKNKLNLP